MAELPSFKNMRPIMGWKLPGVAALMLAAGAAGYVCGRAYFDNEPTVFYLSLIALSVSLWMLVPTMLLTTVPGLVTIGRTVIMLVVLLPAADYAIGKLQAQVTVRVEPVYSFQAAKGNPEAFRAWWAYYVNEWRRPNGAKASTEMPDPTGILPFLLIPNSSGQFFDSVIKINNFGFRGSNIDHNKGDRFRIIALGESPTFGPNIHRDDRPWPEVLQTIMDSRLACVRHIQVINAGTAAYDLENNLERVRKDIIPLEPDLVISYHGHNGLRFLDINPDTMLWLQEPTRRNGPSALIDEAIYRVRFSLWRARLYLWKKTQGPVSTLPLFFEDEVLRSRYAELYRELIRLGRENHFQVVLANSSMAVTASSPPEVREFYGRTFLGIDLLIAKIAAHNYMIKKIADAEGVLFIDTTPHLAGVWDADLFLDPVHFTQKGNNLLAQHMFDGLAPVLRRDESLRCIERYR